MDDSRVRHLVTFGALMLVLVGAFNIIDGLVALINPDYLHPNLLVAGLTAWGWAVLIIGALQLLAGIGVLLGSEVALWAGIALAMGNAVMQLTNVAQNPVWSITILAGDVLVMFGFAAQGLRVGVKPAPGRPEAAAREATTVR
jgi:hypothetical protein